MAQTIETAGGFSLASTPTGGPVTARNSVYIIGDTIRIAVTYTSDLQDPGSPTLRFRIGATQIRTTNPCIRDQDPKKLLCDYVVKEGDASGTDNIVVESGDQLQGGGSITDRGLNQPTTLNAEVDGVRLALNSIGVTGLTGGVGFNAGSTIALALTFGDGTTVPETDMSNSGTLAATLVLANGERPARYTSTSQGVVTFNYVVVAGDNGAFGLKLTGVDALSDRNGNRGLGTGWATIVAEKLASLPTASRRVDTRGPRVTQILFRGASANAADRGTPANVLTAPVKDGYVFFDVFFDEPVLPVPSTTTLRVVVGQATESTETCIAAAGSEWMRCNLPIGTRWLDTDGLSTPANPLNYGTLEDDLKNAAVPAFAGQRFSDVKVDAVPPTVSGASIRVAKPEVNSNVVVKVTFSEDISVSGSGAPSATISIDGNSGTAVFASVSGKVVEFRHALGELPDRDPPKTSVPVKLVSINAAGITDLASNDADDDVTDTAAYKTGTTATLKAAPTDGSSQYLDTTAPKLDLITLAGTVKEVYGITDIITYRVLFSESVSISEGSATDKPVSLATKIGSDDVDVDLAGEGVSYTVRMGALDEDSYNGSLSVSGITLFDDGDRVFDGSSVTILNREVADSEGTCAYDDSDTVCTGRGWINDKANDDGAVSGRSETPKISGRLTGRARVDTKRPKVNSVTLMATPGPGAVGTDRQKYYGRDEKIRIEVTMDEDISIVGDDPALAISIGTQTDTADFKGLRGRVLVFEYDVVGTDCSDGENSATCHVARNGISVTGFARNHSSIKDDGRNSCADADTTCGGTWPSGRNGNHGVDATLTGDQEYTPFEEQAPQQAQTVPVVTRSVVRSTTPTGGYYKTGDRITIEVSLTPAVTFTSAPQLLVNFDEGGSQRLTPAERISSSGTPTTRLTYSYDVASGDEDLDGFTASLSGGGTATVEDGRRATLGSVSVSGIRIDALAPELDSLRITSSAGSDGTYTEDDIIVVSATFSEDVERQGTSDPSVRILVGEQTRMATLQSPSSTSGGDTWVFSYKVVAGDNDADGVSIAADALDGALEDAAGNDADIGHSAVSASTSHKVDTQGPSVTAVAVTGAGDNDLFLEGETITVAVTFDEEVDVARTGSNAVRVQFNIGTSPETATYAGGDGTETLTFTYEVVAGDSGQIFLPADALEGEVEDAAGNEAEGTLALSGGPYTVDASAPMLVGAPSISSAPRTGDTYAVDETITLQVRFDEPVMVTGEPRLPIQVGPRPRNIVLYTSGSGTDTLTFSYTVRNGDTDDDGVSVDANALRLPAGAAIADVNGLTAAIEHGALADQPGHKVDAIAPGIESVAITSTPASDDAYLIDETIEVTVTFSEDIATDGTPTLDLMVGEGVRAAACAQGSASTQLTCSYTVMANDFDPNGISVDADMLEGTITDMVGNSATLTHEALVDDPAHKVYAAAPEAVRTIDRLSLAAGGGTNSLDLTGIFTGFQLSYAAVSSNTNVATATVSGTDLTVVSGMEGTARVTVTASNLAGEASVSFDVLVATDPAETAVLNDALAAIGRSMLSSTASVIGSRFELASTGSQMALGGSRFGGSLSPQMQRYLAGNDPFALEERMSERALFSGSGTQQAHGGGYGLTADRLFTGTSFNMPLNAMGTGDAQFAVWGAGDLQSFEGEPDDGMYDGSSSSGYIGVDARGDGWLAGVSVSRSGAEADYDFDGTAQVTGVRGGGTLETSVTAFHPYARLEVGADSEVWVIGGFGGGEADLSRTHVSGSQSSDLSMAMAVGGLRRALAMEFGGADLSLRGDAGFLSLETDSGAMAVDGLSASVSRLRLGLEAAWEGESATPFVEVSGRFDGGDGQTGGGLELAGGLRILNAESGFGLEAKGRILAMHTGDGYSESGIGVTASFEPGAAGRGITFRLSPRWGGSADSTDLFWDEVGNVRDASQYAYGLDRAQTWGVDAALGYGFGLRSMPGVVTPFGQMDVTGDQDQRIRVGVRYGLMQGLLGGTQVELSAERVDGEMHRVGETRVLVSGRARF